MSASRDVVGWVWICLVMLATCHFSHHLCVRFMTALHVIVTNEVRLLELFSQNVRSLLNIESGRSIGSPESNVILILFSRLLLSFA
jgi:hypothetical protein